MIPVAPRPALATTFGRWSFARGVCARGYWLVTSVYLVVVADLSPAELVLLGTGQGVTVLLAEIPAGVLADTVSRKRAVVAAHLISGTGMAMAGLVTSFPALAASQALWGLGWAFTSGADVAWITDELDRPDLVDRVLAANARWGLLGAATGLVTFGALAWVAGLAPAVVTSGLAMIALGLWVAIGISETRFTPAPAGERWRASVGVLRGGLRLARWDRVILLVLAAWLLVNGSAEGYGRLVERRLVGLGFGGTGDAIVWFTALGLATLLLGAAALRAVEAHIDGAPTARRAYVATCIVGAVGLVVFAHAPDARFAVAAVLLARGLGHAGGVVRPLTEIWVNRRVTSDVRATIHSLLSQAEHAGEIAFGALLAAIAATTSATASLTGAAVLGLAAALIASRARDG